MCSYKKNCDFVIGHQNIESIDGASVASKPQSQRLWNLIYIPNKYSFYLITEGHCLFCISMPHRQWT